VTQAYRENAVTYLSPKKQQANLLVYLHTSGVEMGGEFNPLSSPVANVVTYLVIFIRMLQNLYFIYPI